MGAKWAVVLCGVLLARPAWAIKPRCDEAEHTMERAGHPDHQSKLAKPSETKGYVGYYVGGGSPFKSCWRPPQAGTWGWDYQGCVLPRKVFLHWWCCPPKYQGGTGAY